MEEGLIAIMKPTNGCNMDCSYCYLPPFLKEVKHDGKSLVMDDETLINSMTKVSRYNGTQRTGYFIWHGGEPTLVQKSFYEKVVDITNDLSGKGYRLQNSIQTNGFDVDNEFLDYLMENNFKIGVSVDGPKQYHDKTRKDKEGHGTFDKIFETIKFIKQRNERVGAIIVVNQLNYDGLNEAYDFFSQNEIGFRMNPLIHAGSAINNWEDIRVKPDQYGRALVKIFDRWICDDSSNIPVQPLEDMLKMVFFGKPLGCEHSRSCQNYFLSIGPSGDVYPCGRFDGIEAFKFGNVNSEELDKILSHPLRDKLKERWKNLEECSKCSFEQICYGGCMENAFSEDDVMKKDPYCSSYKLIFNHIQQFLADYFNLKPLENGKIVTLPEYSNLVNIEGIENQKINRALQSVVNQDTRFGRVSPGFCHRDYSRYGDHSRYADHSDCHSYN